MPLYRAPATADTPYPAGLLIAAASAHGANGTIGAADLLYLRRIVPRVTLTIDGLGARVATGGAGSSMKIAAWREAAASRVPTGVALAANNAGVATASNSANAVASVAVSRLLAGVPIWIGQVFTGTLPGLALILSSDLEFAQGIGAGLGNSAPVTQQGFTIAQPYANDIAALDLTGASLTAFNGAGMPIPLLRTA